MLGIEFPPASVYLKPECQGHTAQPQAGIYTCADAHLATSTSSTLSHWWNSGAWPFHTQVTFCPAALRNCCMCGPVLGWVLCGATESSQEPHLVDICSILELKKRAQGIKVTSPKCQLGFNPVS